MKLDEWLTGKETLAADATTARTFGLPSPTTGEPVAEVRDCGPKEALEAVAVAHEELGRWRNLTAYERAEALVRWHDAIFADRESIAQLITLEMGKPIREARGEVIATAQTIKIAAEEATRIFGATIPSRDRTKHLWTVAQPMGVAYCITPWNFPAAMVARKAAPALAAGCTVLLKPAEQTPLTALALSRLWSEVRNPPGALQVLTTSDPGQLTDTILEQPEVRKVSFTGSTPVGRQLYAKAAARLTRVSLELGGHAPFIVFDDADLERAVDAVTATKFGNAGQKCISTNRLLVHRSVAGEFTTRVAEKANTLRVGDPRHEDTDVGPLVNGSAVKKAAAHLHDALARGATLRCGGTIDGGYIHPTVLDCVSDDMDIFTNETFGPILPIAVFDQDNEAFESANTTPFGLAAYVFTRDVGRVHQAANQLDFGIIGINDIATVESQAPFGGLKDSGVGREGGRWGVESFLDLKYVSLTHQL